MYRSLSFIQRLFVLYISSEGLYQRVHCIAIYRINCKHIKFVQARDRYSQELQAEILTKTVELEGKMRELEVSANSKSATPHGQ